MTGFFDLKRFAVGPSPIVRGIEAPPILTLASAKAYVARWHADNGAAADIIGCGFITQHDTAMVRLNVDLTDNETGARDFVQWDVWVEGDRLYGEF